MATVGHSGLTAMIHFHGTPISGAEAIVSRLLLSRFAFVSFARPDQMALVSETTAGFALDNGAFSFWKRQQDIDWDLYRSWVLEWYRHPAYQFAILPDVIGGSEEENDDLLQEYGLPGGVPVFHQGESLDRLERIANQYSRVALGATEVHIPSDTFYSWLDDCMTVLCDSEGKPKVRLHGLRMLNPEIFQRYPFSSCDSTNLGQNYNTPVRWAGTYNPVGPEMRGLVLRDRIESFQAPCRFEPPRYQQISLFAS